MPNEAEAQEEVLENEKRGQNIKGQNLNPAGNTCGWPCPSWSNPVKSVRKINV